jgi:hypothetical protein
MRLINVETMQLEDFTMRRLPQYAILSHTWTEEEVSFQEFSNQTTDIVKKEGFIKIMRTCGLAAENHVKYVWVDTCCIDKTSSAELTEAINSMFQWYKEAEYCFAYLSDFSWEEEEEEDGYHVRDMSNIMWDACEAMRCCKWFTRGWTLQELLAPKVLAFYDSNWTYRGTRQFFSAAINKLTHIDEEVLNGQKELDEVSITERMNWASKRETTRLEDMAYCLLGIFDINMPLLYGEGNKAFIRLQEEIIRSSVDLSIFGWSPDRGAVMVEGRPALPDGCGANCSHGADKDGDFYSILATSPKDFFAPHSYHVSESAEHSITNRGIKIHCSLLEICLRGCYSLKCTCCSDTRNYVLDLGSPEKGIRCGVLLDKISPDVFIRSNKLLARLDTNRLKPYSITNTRSRTIYLLTKAPRLVRKWTNRTLTLKIREGSDLSIRSVAPDHRWNFAKRCLYLENSALPWKEWGMVSLKYTATFGPPVTVCVLFRNLSDKPSVVHSHIYKSEVALISKMVLA